ncbi:MAG: DUF1566 domain-containing protein [Deltaproteobacteria bacterium]|nr:DUF1566 domain-containing protein [Deltaproteobacteria bacterium]
MTEDLISTTIRAAALACCALLGGCEILAALSGGEGLPCSSDQSCPRDMLCIDRRCARLSTCRNSADCETGWVCVNNICLMRFDAGAGDARVHDAAALDAAVVDVASTDLAMLDTAIPDAASPDGATPDAATPDAALPDAAMVDAAMADAAMADAAMADAAMADAAMADAVSPDTGMVNECSGEPDFTPCSLTTSPDYGYDVCIGGACVSPGSCGTEACNTGGPHFALPDTNQRQCYDNSAAMTCPSSGEDFFGQDTQYGWDTAHLASERYTRSTAIADQPVVTDSVTGLEWQGCAAGQTGATCQTGSAATMTRQHALDHCEGLTWGGSSDWRLPDQYELQSIVDHGRFDPSIDFDAFPATPGVRFWSSSSYRAIVGDGDAWYVSFDYGDVSHEGKSLGYDVRCVRSGQPVAPVIPRFTRAENVVDQPVVADAVTRLIWQGCTAGQTGATCQTGSGEIKTWQQALAYCEGLTWGGSSDWRLPDTKELASLVDDTRVEPSIDVTAFPATPESWFWSSSSYAKNCSAAWSVEFQKGSVIYFFGKILTEYVRCVRTGL